MKKLVSLFLALLMVLSFGLLTAASGRTEGDRVLDSPCRRVQRRHPEHLRRL